MPKLEKKITIEAPVEEVFKYLDTPTNLPEIWPSLFEVKDVKTRPDGGHSFVWFYNLAGKRVQGTTETFERMPYERIIDKARGDVESLFTWTFHGENGTTEVKFEADYELPERLVKSGEKPFIIRRNDFEAEMLLENLKVKLEV